MLEKAERFAPGAGKKHRAKADSEYAQAVVDGNSEQTARHHRPGPAAGGQPVRIPTPDRAATDGGNASAWC